MTFIYLFKERILLTLENHRVRRRPTNLTGRGMPYGTEKGNNTKKQYCDRKYNNLFPLASLGHGHDEIIF